ncbi:alpha/beta hydrolase [Nocardia higoensis]|uniref:alpha/beta hydrolase n=1 Tax=Nocardia higoensis TaxID=228599 RepID=UPI000A065620
MSGLIAEVPRPRAVLVALHGGATSAAYFDCPGHPELSLMRTAARLGFTVLALDRPGYGASAPFAEDIAPAERRVDLIYASIEHHLAERPRGAGVFLLAHSAGCELALRIAADDRGAGLLGLELAGTGRLHQPVAQDILWEDKGPRPSAYGIGKLLWHPERLYSASVLGGASIAAPGPRTEAVAVRDWAGQEFPALAGQVRIPVRFTVGDHERVWRNDPEELTEVGSLFSASPRVVLNFQPNTGHNISVGHTATAYHLKLLSFVEECVVADANGEFSGPATQFDGSAVARPGTVDDGTP